MLLSGLTPTKVIIWGLTANEYVPNGQSASYVMQPYEYVNISYLISSCDDGVQVVAPQAGIPQSSYEGFCGLQTVTLIISCQTPNYNLGGSQTRHCDADVTRIHI